MKFVETTDALAALYPEPPVQRALDKVQDHLTPAYRTWIETARFCILTTVGPEGTDSSPRGDDGPVMTMLDPKTLAMPDWRGNYRIDSLRNIVRDGRGSALFLVPGSLNVVRVNGRLRLTADDTLRARFEKKGVQPRSVIVLEVAEVYFQCAKAVMRSGLWTRQGDAADLPSAGDFLREADEGFDAAAYDADYSDYAANRMW